MKKSVIVFAISAIVMLIATVNAQGAMNDARAVDGGGERIEKMNTQENDSINFNFRIRLRDLNKALHLEADQQEDIQLIHNEMFRQIAQLKKVSENERQSKLANIISFDLRSMQDVLDESQYRTYLTLLNKELANAGLGSLIYGNKMLSKK